MARSFGRFVARLSRLQQEARLRAAHAVSLMRTQPNTSLEKAAREAHTTPETVRHNFPGSVSMGPKGRYRISRADREPFAMVIVSVEEGVTERMVRGSHKRELLGAHHNAVGRFLRPGGGDPEVLAPFVGKKVAGLTLMTDPDALEETWRRGQLDFLEIYALTS